MSIYISRSLNSLNNLFFLNSLISKKKHLVLRQKIIKVFFFMEGNLGQTTRLNSSN
jgi:hypothetical protein